MRNAESNETSKNLKEELMKILDQTISENVEFLSF